MVAVSATGQLQSRGEEQEEQDEVEEEEGEEEEEEGEEEVVFQGAGGVLVILGLPPTLWPPRPLASVRSP